jgi:hypothetical protein
MKFRIVFWNVLSCKMIKTYLIFCVQTHTHTNTLKLKMAAFTLDYFSRVGVSHGIQDKI